MEEEKVLFKGCTCKFVSLLCRLEIRFFQSSRALLVLARTPSTLSFAATLVNSSLLNSTLFTLLWPCSLSLRNSCGTGSTYWC